MPGMNSGLNPASSILVSAFRSALLQQWLIVALIFGVINALLKPVIHTIGCAFYVLTLGLAAIVVNALLLWLTSYIVYDKLHEPFHVTGFTAAVEGALIVGVVTWLLHLALGRD